MTDTAPAKHAPQQAAVRQARDRLVQDLETLDSEVRLEVAYRMEKLAWKLIAGIAGAVAAFLVAKVLNTAWSKTRPSPPPTNPADPETGWTDALLWAAATGVGLGIGKMIAERGTAIGWKKATGRVAPPFEKLTRS